MSPESEAVLFDYSASGWGWLTRVGRYDPVGPLVVVHALSLAVLGMVERPVGVLVTAGGLLVWRSGLAVLAGRVEPVRRGVVFLVRGVGSLVLVGGIVVWDGGTESPLFFSLVVLVVWETVMNPLRRLIVLGGVAVMVYVGVIFAARDVTSTSLVRLGVFVAFLGLLVWARALAEFWQRESAEARELAAGIAEKAPIGFALYESGSQRCLFANEAATGFGLDLPDETIVTPYGTPLEAGVTVSDVLAGVVALGEPLLPSLFVISPGEVGERFLRIGVTIRPVADGDDLLMVYAEDVSGQVSVGEQHRLFLESANHQFRTPLSPIMAYSELIAVGELEGEELLEAGVIIGDAARRIEKLLDRIGSLLRLQRDPNRSATAVRVGELIDQYLLAVDPDLRGCLTVEGGSDLMVRCDPLALSNSLSELVDNGRRHGTPPVVIDAGSVDGRVVLRLRDQGPGPDIDPDMALDQTWGLLAHPEVMPSEMGERLGIVFAYTLTRVAGGSLRFERDPTGWAFVFELPAGDQQVPVTRVGEHR